jgi:CBS domain-containing protein
MQRTVHDIMNRELFLVRAEDKGEPTLESAIEHGVTTVPVLDAGRRPLGVFSLRDLVRKDRRPHMSSPAPTVLESATVAEAGRALTAANVHELVVIDEAGRAIGTVSALDVLRGLVGRPLRHPEAFPHRDTRFGLSWSGDHDLVPEGLSDVPDAPGVLVLFEGRADREESMRGAESCSSIRTRIDELLSAVRTESPLLARNLKYRFALVFDPDRRDQITAELRDILAQLVLPQDVPVASARA